jgi:hypothetical protein
MLHLGMGILKIKRNLKSKMSADKAIAAGEESRPAKKPQKFSDKQIQKPEIKPRYKEPRREMTWKQMMNAALEYEEMEELSEQNYQPWGETDA